VTTINTLLDLVTGKCTYSSSSVETSSTLTYTTFHEPYIIFERCYKMFCVSHRTTGKILHEIKLWFILKFFYYGVLI